VAVVWDLVPGLPVRETVPALWRVGAGGSVEMEDGSRFFLQMRPDGLWLHGPDGAERVSWGPRDVVARGWTLPGGGAAVRNLALTVDLRAYLASGPLVATGLDADLDSQVALEAVRRYSGVDFEVVRRVPGTVSRGALNLDVSSPAFPGPVSFDGQTLVVDHRFCRDCRSTLEALRDRFPSLRVPAQAVALAHSPEEHRARVEGKVPLGLVSDLEPGFAYLLAEHGLLEGPVPPGVARMIGLEEALRKREAALARDVQVKEGVGLGSRGDALAAFARGARAAVEVWEEGGVYWVARAAPGEALPREVLGVALRTPGAVVSPDGSFAAGVGRDGAGLRGTPEAWLEEFARHLAPRLELGRGPVLGLKKE